MLDAAELKTATHDHLPKKVKKGNKKKAE